MNIKHMPVITQDRKLLEQQIRQLFNRFSSVYSISFFTIILSEYNVDLTTYFNQQLPELQKLVEAYGWELGTPQCLHDPKIGTEATIIIKVKEAGV